MSIPIPPPPKEQTRPRGKRKGSSRFGTWLGALALGGGLGAASYRFLDFISDYFDYWAALLLA
ncbi:MAG: hypothetical protein AAF928_19210 [Myxococcota bacterium]